MYYEQSDERRSVLCECEGRTLKDSSPTRMADPRITAGQSVIEVIVAVSLMVIIAASSVIAVLGSFKTSLLAEQETKASFLANQGIEATQSIRNQSWDNLTNGNHGLTNSGDTWAFSGTSDTDASGVFTRIITIADVQRNDDGNIVISGGTVDEDTKQVLSSITWNFTPTRSLTVDLTSLLTNWQLGRSPAGAGAPVFTTCTQYCQSLDYTTGTCRQNASQCPGNGEDYRPVGNQYCTGGASADTCCCEP